MNYTVKEVRQYARITDGMVSLSKLTDMLTELAERIEADEGSVPAATSCADHAKGETGYCTFHTNVPWGTNLFTHPPAQAAQVDQVGELLAIIHGDGGHYQAEHGLQKAAKDAQEKVIQMMTKIATAEPVAQGEVANPLADDSPLQSCRAFVESWRLESAGSNGHDVIANRNTVRRLVHIIDHLAAESAQPTDNGQVADVHAVYCCKHGVDLRTICDKCFPDDIALAAAPSPGESA